MEGQSYTFLSKQFFTFFIMISTSVLIHFQETQDALKHLEDIDLKYTQGDGEYDAIVDDVPYEIVDGTYQDPDEQLCEFYGINYDLVNCIESA